MKIRQYIFRKIIRYFPHAGGVPLNEYSVSFEYLCSMIRDGEEFEFMFHGVSYEIVQYVDKKELYEHNLKNESKLIATFKSVEDFELNAQINGENLSESWTRSYTCSI